MLKNFWRIALVVCMGAPLCLSAQETTSGGHGPFEVKTKHLSGVSPGDSATLKQTQQATDANNKAITDGTFTALKEYCKGLIETTVEGSINENAGECTTTDGKPGTLKKWKEFNGEVADDLLSNLGKVKITCTESRAAAPPAPGETKFKVEATKAGNDRRDTALYTLCDSEDKEECIPLPEDADKVTEASLYQLFAALE